MRPRGLDHVALFVSDPERTASSLLNRLPFRVLEHTDEFVLVGRAPDLRKITLFEAGGPREQGALVRIGIGIPCGTESQTLTLEDGLVLELVPTEPDGDVEVEHVALRVSDPAQSERAWLEFGFQPMPVRARVHRIRVGGAVIELHAGRPPGTDRPLLGHLGLAVDSLDDVRRTAARTGMHVLREVDAANSVALFVRGPDGVELEYIEHAPASAFA